MTAHKLLVIGHRGAKGLAPENTIASFDKALEHHVDAIELDVHLTKDCQIAVNHDTFVTDPSGNHLEIKSHSLEELRQHKPDLATLQEAVSYIDRRVPIMIEVKPGVPPRPIIKAVKAFLEQGWQAQDFWFGSRSMPILEELHAKMPEISLVVIEFWSGVRATRRARKLGTKRIGMLEYGLWSGFIAAMKRGGYELYSAPPGTSWKKRLFSKLGMAGQTDDPQKAGRWAKHGLAGVITDYPDRFEKR